MIFITIKNMMSNYESLLNCTMFCMVLTFTIIRFSAKNSTQLELSFKSNSEMIYQIELLSSLNTLKFYYLEQYKFYHHLDNFY